MKSKAVLLALTLALLITAPSTFAAPAAPAPAAPAAAPAAAPPPAKAAPAAKEKAMPAKKAHKKAKKGEGESGASSPKENRADPCRVDNLPGCN